ncbi:hypothetical protein K458DRAFT_196421 [Lentithecium fluviatile CBS 122367]|uniref:MYND-type domain-containing protein n=1 Tax=Lentithecium fluviatile CBS 122367 TaxID=1168545 RepID=A0A6G1ICG8_9PLEO|nr:hypothetical protein K458DRAFT_196421 [Lentithecium fluviatile CBS 122367]
MIEKEQTTSHPRVQRDCSSRHKQVARSQLPQICHMRAYTNNSCEIYKDHAEANRTLSSHQSRKSIMYGNKKPTSNYDAVLLSLSQRQSPRCNNPNCSKESGEDGIPLLRCQQCRHAHYCLRECESQHREVHKFYCALTIATTNGPNDVTDILELVTTRSREDNTKASGDPDTVFYIDTSRPWLTGPGLKETKGPFYSVKNIEFPFYQALVTDDSIIRTPAIRG